MASEEIKKLLSAYKKDGYNGVLPKENKEKQNKVKQEEAIKEASKNPNNKFLQSKGFGIKTSNSIVDSMIKSPTPQSVEQQAKEKEATKKFIQENANLNKISTRQNYSKDQLSEETIKFYNTPNEFAGNFRNVAEVLPVIKNSPTAVNKISDLGKLAGKIAQTIDRAGKKGAQFLVGEEAVPEDAIPTTGNKLLDTITDVGGYVMGASFNPMGGGVPSMLSASNKLGESVLNKIPNKIISNNSLMGKVARGSIEGAVTTAPLTAYSSIVNKDTPEQALQRATSEIGTGLVLGGALRGTGNLINKGVNKLDANINNTFTSPFKGAGDMNVTPTREDIFEEIIKDYRPNTPLLQSGARLALPEPAIQLPPIQTRASSLDGNFKLKNPKLEQATREYQESIYKNEPALNQRLKELKVNELSRQGSKGVLNNINSNAKSKINLNNGLSQTTPAFKNIDEIPINNKVQSQFNKEQPFKATRNEIPKSNPNLTRSSNGINTKSTKSMPKTSNMTSEVAQEISPTPTKRLRVDTNTGTGKYKTSKFYQSAKNSKVLSEESKALLKEEDFLREIKSNKKAAEKAISAVEKDADRYANRLMNKKALESDVDSAGVFAVVDNLQNKGKYEEAANFVTNMRSKISSTAEALQALSMQGRTSGAKMLMTASKVLEEATDKTILKTANEAIESVGASLNRINKDIADSWDFMKHGINLQLFAKAHPQDKAIKQGLKDLDIKLNDIVKKHYNDLEGAGKSLSEKIVKQTGISGKAADDLANQIKVRFKELTQSKKEAEINKILKINNKKSVKKDYGTRIIELSNLGAVGKQQYSNLVYKKFNIPTLTGEQAKNIIDQANKIQKIANVNQREAAINKLMFYIKSLTKPSAMEKIRAARNISMLFGTKTQERNVLGNLSHYVANKTAKVLATGIDMAKSKLTGTERQITFKTGRGSDLFKEFFSDVKEGGKAGWQGYSLYGADDVMTASRKIFTGKWNPLNYMESVLGSTLKGVDYGFYMASLKDTLGEMAHLKGINEGLKGTALKEATQKYMDEFANSALKMSDDVKAVWDKARESAQKIVGTDKNFFSKTSQTVKEGLNKLGVGKTIRGSEVMQTKEFGLGDVVSPFARIAGSLLNTGLEYSPAGFAKSMYYLYKMARNSEGLGKQYYEKSVDTVSKAILGTLGLTGTGYWLAKNGAVTGKSEENKSIREFQESQGMKPYSANIDAITRFAKSGFKDKSLLKAQKGDSWYTYEWLMPLATSIGMGANIAKGDNAGTAYYKALADTFSASLNAIAENQSIADVIQASRGKDIKDTAASITAGLPASFIPQIVNNIRQGTDPIIRDAKDDDNFKYAKNLLINKIPGLSESLPAKINPMGEMKQTYQGSNSFGRWANVLFNPSFVSKYSATPETELLMNLYNKTKKSEILPKIKDDTLTIDKTKYYPNTKQNKNKSIILQLTPQQRLEFQKEIGNLTIQSVNELMNSNKFKNLKEEEKIKQLGNLTQAISKKAQERIEKKLGKQYIKQKAK